MNDQRETIETMLSELNPGVRAAYLACSGFPNRRRAERSQRFDLSMINGAGGTLSARPPLLARLLGRRPSPTASAAPRVNL